MALISNRINKDDPLSNVQGYESAQIQMDDSDSVESRVAGLISRNSDIMRQAETRANQGSASRGLLNSSMAVGAAHGAVMDRALPIASQDAATSFATKQSNQAASNRADEFTATGINQAESQVYNTQQTQQLQQGQQAHQTALQELVGEQTLEQQERGGLISSRLQSEQADIESRLQAERAQQALEQQAAGGEIESRLLSERAALESELATALQNNDIAAQERIQARQAEIDREMQILRGQQALEQQQQAGQIESQLLNERATLDSELQLAIQNNDIAAQERIQQRQAQIDTELQELRGQQELERLAAQGDIEAQLMIEGARIEEELQLALQENDLAAQERLMEMQNENQLRLQAAQGELDAQLMVRRMELEEQLQLALQSNDLEYQERLLGMRHQNERDLMVLQASENRETLELENVLDMERQTTLAGIEQQYALQRDMLQASNVQDRDRLLAELEEDRNQQIQQFEANMQQMQQNHELDLNGLRESHELIMQSSVNGANIYNSLLTQLASIYQNPDIPEGSRNQFASDAIAFANTSLATLNEIMGVDNAAIWGSGGGGQGGNNNQSGGNGGGGAGGDYYVSDAIIPGSGYSDPAASANFANVIAQAQNSGVDFWRSGRLDEYMGAVLDPQNSDLNRISGLSNLNRNQTREFSTSLLNALHGEDTAGVFDRHSDISQNEVDILNRIWNLSYSSQNGGPGSQMIELQMNNLANTYGWDYKDINRIIDEYTAFGGRTSGGNTWDKFVNQMF